MSKFTDALAAYVDAHHRYRSLDEQIRTWLPQPPPPDVADLLDVSAREASQAADVLDREHAAVVRRIAVEER